MELYLGAAFQVEIEGLGGASFSRASGLGARVEVVRVQEGGVPSPRLLPGEVLWEPLVLERGWIEDPRLWRWFQSREPRSGSVSLLAPDGSPRGRWSFERAWPSRWQGPSFDANRDEVALELLEIVHEGLRWEEVP